MKKRSPATPLLLSIITFGIYGIVWLVKTKVEMNESGASIPTAWLLIVPIVSFYWLWKCSEGVEAVTKNGMSKVSAFVLLLLLNVIGAIFVQSALTRSQRPSQNRNFHHAHRLGLPSWQPQPA